MVNESLKRRIQQLEGIVIRHKFAIEDLYALLKGFSQRMDELEAEGCGGA